MLITRSPKIPRSEVTDRAVYLNRREFVLTAGATILGARSTSAAGRPAAHGAKLEGLRKSRLSSSELPTRWDQITSYNNFYEFAGSDNKDLPSELAPGNLVTKAWTVAVEGACAKPGQFPLEEVVKGQDRKSVV